MKYKHIEKEVYDWNLIIRVILFSILWILFISFIISGGVTIIILAISFIFTDMSQTLAEQFVLSTWKYTFLLCLFFISGFLIGLLKSESKEYPIFKKTIIIHQGVK